MAAAEVVWAGYTLSRPLPKNVPGPTGEPEINSQPTLGGSLAGIALQGPSQASVGDTFKADIELSANSPSTGADVIIKYDPEVLQVVPSGTAAATAGKIFQSYPANTFDPKGIITLSGTSVDKGFSGQGVFASINFKAKDKGLTKIEFDFTPGLTTDSNVIEVSSGSDILKKVSNLELTIR